MASIAAVVTEDYNKHLTRLDRERSCACRVQDSDWSRREWLDGCEIFQPEFVKQTALISPPVHHRTVLRR
jgi:hypothetical protein